MKYGIFGCTADPFTCAHYAIVNKVLKDGLVDKVIVIPTVVDYHRKDKKRLFTNEQRLAIIRKWFENRDDVIVDGFEYDLIADNPTLQKDRRYYHTLMDAMLRYGKDNSFMTIVGADSWNNITSWFNFRELGLETKFIVFSRANQTINFYINYPEYHYQPYKVIELDKKFENVSATEIRNDLERICGGMSLGPSATPFNIYIEEIEHYKETRERYKDLENAQEEVRKTIDDPLNDALEIKTSNVKQDTLVAHTPIFDLVKGPEVEEGFEPVKIKSPDWVTIIVERDGMFLMEKQLRHGLNKEFEEFPCGMVEEGELPIVSALRELKEETGIEPKRYSLTYFGKFAANPAFMTNYMHYFHLKLDDYVSGKPKLDEHEHLTVYWLEKKNAFEHFMKSEGSSIMGCAWMLLMKNGVLNEWT